MIIVIITLTAAVAIFACGFVCGAGDALFRDYARAVIRLIGMNRPRVRVEEPEEEEAPPVSRVELVPEPPRLSWWQIGETHECRWRGVTVAVRSSALPDNLRGPYGRNRAFALWVGPTLVGWSQTIEEAKTKAETVVSRLEVRFPTGKAPAAAILEAARGKQRPRTTPVAESAARS